MGASILTPDFMAARADLSSVEPTSTLSAPMEG